MRFMAVQNRVTVLALVVALTWLQIAGRATSISLENSQFNESFSVVWEDQNVAVVDEGKTQAIQLTLNQASGCAIGSKHTYLYGYFRASMRLIPGNSAGTLASFYLSSNTNNHDELDFEFLGNVTGQPYVLQTNVFANGTGGREQRHSLWFDPRDGFHNYSVLWNQYQIVFYVDGVVIRAFQNHQAAGQAYPSNQAMGIYASIFNADQWATRGGLDKIDWSAAPFVASYTNFAHDGCVWDTSFPIPSSCVSKGHWWDAVQHQTLGYALAGQLEWAKQTLLLYDYCTDSIRYPTPPYECTVPVY